MAETMAEAIGEELMRKAIKDSYPLCEECGQKCTFHAEKMVEEAKNFFAEGLLTKHEFSDAVGRSNLMCQEFSDIPF